MTTTNEPKYKIQDGKIVNRQDGIPIPDDEPIFILRGKDAHAFAALAGYAKELPNRLDATHRASHREAVLKRLAQFAKFAADHPNRMKEPDTTLTPDWP